MKKKQSKTIARRPRKRTRVSATNQREYDELSHVGGGSGHSPKPPVKWIPSPNRASREGKDIDTLVLHNTDGSLGSAINRFMAPTQQVSAHYLIDRDGTIIQMVDDSGTAWHSGNREINQRSIGIEVVAWSEARSMAGVQEQSLIALCKYVLTAYDVSVERVFPHRAIRATDCPGWVWPTDQDLEVWKRANLIP